MRALLERLRRLIVGEPIETDRAQARPMRTRLAIAFFGSGILSAVVYAPDALASSLRTGNQQGAIPWVALGVVAVMLILGFAYRSTVVETGGKRGDYGVVSQRLGPRAGVVSGAALLVDYLLTLAVSVAALTHVARYLWPDLSGYQAAVGVGVVGVMTLGNLRGVRERSRIVTAVWLAFVAAVVAVAVVGLARHATDDIAPHITAHPSGWSVILAYGGAIASGAVMVTGIEHLGAAGRFHEEPSGVRAGRTLIIAVSVSAVLFFAIAYLSWAYSVDDWDEGPALLQVGDAIFARQWPLYVVGVAAIGILYAAGSGVFRRFTQLASHLARDGFLPRQLRSLSDRYVFTYGILALGAAAGVVIAAARGDLESLVHVYIVGVFTSIVLSQVAMIGHWGRVIALETDRVRLARAWGYRTLHASAALVGAAVWLDVVIFKFASGAWMAVALMALLVTLMWGVRRHYDRVRVEVTAVPGDRSGALPSRTHGIVLVSQIHRPALRALAYARAMRHDTLAAVGVAVDKRMSQQLQADWAKLDSGMRLVILDSPYRDFIGPVLKYVRAVRRGSPREMVVVYVPEYVITRWWQRFLHNRSGARLRAKLLEIPGVVVTAVPWHLQSGGGRGADARVAPAARARSGRRASDDSPGGGTSTDAAL